jgi:surface protein
VEILENWDVSNIVNFSFVFEATKFNSDISGWDTSIATNFQSMFFSKVNNLTKILADGMFKMLPTWIQMLFSSSLISINNLGNWEIASLTSANNNE